MEAAERQTLVAQLAHADEEMRRLAVERTSLLDADEAIALLLGRLCDESWRVRKAAIERLASLPATEAVVAALLQGLADGENPGHRNAALEALVHCGRAAVPALLRALQAPDVDVRKQVVDVIAAIGDPRAGDELLPLLGDADPNVRAAAADALARVGRGEHAATLLARFAEDSEPLVRLALLRALVALEVPIALDALDDALADPILRGAAYAALGASGDPAAAERIAKGMLASRESVRDAAMEAAAALVARCAPDRVDSVVHRLRELARSHSEVVRNACERLSEAPESRRLPLVQLLGVLRAPEAALPLLRAGVAEPLADAASEGLCALGDDWERTLQEAWGALAVAERAFACRVLERGGSARGVRLLRAALGDETGEVREAAARGLGRRGHLEALGDLIARLLGSEDAERVSSEELRELVAAVAAIAERGEGNGVDAALALVEARLMRGGERARLAAAQLLGRLARPSDGARVRALLTDPSPAVRRASVEAAPRLGEAAGELLRFALADEATPVRVAAAAALARSASPNADTELAALTEDREARVRAAAMGALGMRCARIEARASGLALLARGVEQEGVVALAALAALEAVGGVDAARAARAGLASPEAEIAERAAACIGLHGEADELALLLPLLRHAAWSVRARAARELGERRVSAAFPQLFHRIEEEPDAFVRDALLRAVAALER